MNRTRVLIIEKHENVRAALLAKLDSDRDLSVSGMAVSGSRDIEDALKLQPDVVLLEVKRGDGSGIEICRRIIRERPSTRVLVLTSYPDEREETEVRAMGAAYLFKDLDVRQLVRQIKASQAPECIGNP